MDSQSSKRIEFARALVAMMGAVREGLRQEGVQGGRIDDITRAAAVEVMGRYCRNEFKGCVGAEFSVETGFLRLPFQVR